MDTGPAGRVLREIRTLYTLGTLGGLTDAELLDRFLARGGVDAEDAFAALVARHGPTVLGVCRRMLPGSHDAEDAFQATFLVLARRAASIGRRERLANWLYGVAVRTAREARRRAVRERAAERRTMDVPRVESESPGDRDDWLPLLDEELNRLPQRYRAALVACELEGKSRREAARELGIPEGTLSAHLARGRKRLREQLLRRGVTLGLGPIAGRSRPAFETAVPDRLMGPTIRAALGDAPGAGATTAMSKTAATLAERVLKMMFLARLTLIVAALMMAAAATMTAVALALATTVVEPPKVDAPKAGPDDLAGRVVDRAGTGVGGVQVWGMDGEWFTPDVVARATTDDQGRYLLQGVVHLIGPPGRSRNLRLFARARDGRVGWRQPDPPGRADPTGGAIELMAVGDARGRLTDQDGRPIAGVEVAPACMSRTITDFVWLSPEVRALFRTMTAADGSFVLKGVPQGGGLHATIAAPKFGSPMISWDTSQAVVLVLDSRLGRIRGRLRPSDGRGVASSFPLALKSSRRSANSPLPFEMLISRDLSTAPDGTFQFDGLPPGRYRLWAYFQQDGIIAEKPETELEVAPGGALTIEIALRRQPKITGRVVDARTGRGIAGVGVETLYREQGRNMAFAEGKVTTDAEGRYAVPARPGKNAVQIGLPKSYLFQDRAEVEVQVEADQVVPDVKLIRAAEFEGIVVDPAGRAVAGAEVYFLMADRPGARSAREPLRSASDGTFRLDRLEGDGLVALWARAGDATTGEPVVVRPREVKGKAVLAVDPKNAVRIRGLAVDSGGRRIAGATATLRWDRWYPVEKGRRPSMSSTSVLATATTGSDGWFVFRNLWPGVDYQVVAEAKGHNNAEAPELTGKAGETHDVGKIVLIDTSGHLAGRVVGSDGRPIAGAGVFNRGDGPGMIATSTDADGRFRLDGMFPGTKYLFVRRPGYRFTGLKADSDADGLTIVLPRPDEPPPAWKPGTGASLDEQRAFARQVLIRLWEKYGTDAQNNGAFQCIQHMAAIDPELAMQWSAGKGHRYDADVRQAEARILAETDPAGAVALLNQKPDKSSQSVLQDLADRFAATDASKALRFAEEAAVQARGLNQPDRTRAIARAGAVLVKLGHPDVGRKLIDEAARDASQLPTERWAGNCRAQVGRIVAAFDPERALAIIRPFQAEQGWRSLPADIAVEIGATDTKRALALLETVDRQGFDAERARTAIAFRIGRDRPDEAIRIIEGIHRERYDHEWQAGAFGWLAVALAPRDRARANSLIDRALAMMIDQRSWPGPDDEMAVAARVAVCARRIGYPDMEGAIMRVLSARPEESRGGSGDRRWHMQHIPDAAVPLALIDPAAARVVLEQVEARGGLDPVTLWNTQPPWLIAWSLVDLEKARTVLEAEMAAIDRQKVDVSTWSMAFYQMVEVLTAPPDRREQVLARRSGGGSWRPDEGF